MKDFPWACVFEHLSPGAGALVEDCRIFLGQHLTGGSKSLGVSLEILYHSPTSCLLSM